MTWVYVGVAVVTTAVSVDQQKSAERKRKRAADISNKQQKLKSGREAVEQVRQAQIARASVLQQGENRGAGDSTAVAGSVGSIQSQAGGNIGFANQIFGMQQSRSRLLQSAIGHDRRARTAEAVGSIAMNAMSMGEFSGGSSTKPVLADNSKGGVQAAGSFVR